MLDLDFHLSRGGGRSYTFSQPTRLYRCQGCIYPGPNVFETKYPSILDKLSQLAVICVYSINACMQDLMLYMLKY